MKTIGRLWGDLHHWMIAANTSAVVKHPFDQLLHARKMRATPVHPPTARTMSEILVTGAYALWQTLHDGLFLDLLQDSVAAHTALEGLYAFLQVKMVDDLMQLITGMILPNTIPIGHRISLQQPAIAREQNAPLLMRDPGKVLIAGAVPIQAVKTQHTHVCRQPSEVRIEDEAHCLKLRGAYIHQRGDIQTAKARICAHPIPVLKRVIKADGHAVDQDKLYLRVRRAQSLDDVLNRWISSIAMLEGRVLLRWGQKIIQFCIKPEVCLMHARFRLVLNT